MPTNKFPKEHLQDLIWEEEIHDLKLIEDEITDNGRWSIHHEMVFQDVSTGKFYLTHYSIGATEQQDERPFEYDGDEIVCQEVVPKEVTVITYVKK